MKKDCLKISFLGDVSLNGQYDEFYEKENKPFLKIAECLKNSVVVGNIECFARGSQGVNELKKPRLETNVETLNYLKDFNIQIASLANNHVYDHLEDGFEKTIHFLKENKIKTIGASLENEKHKKPIIVEGSNIKVAILNYVTDDTNPNPPSDTRIKVNYFELETVIYDIHMIKESVNYVVLTLHWGGRVEGGMFPDWNQPKIAHLLIDAGADLIIGHHSHTIQPYEIYKGKHIFYSLGNFCFSNFNFEGKNHVMPKRGQHTIIPEITFYRDRYFVNNSFWRNRNEYYSEMIMYKYKLLTNNLIFKLHKYKVFWLLYFFIHKKVNPILFYLLRNDMTTYEKLMRLNIIKFKRYLNK